MAVVYLFRPGLVPSENEGEARTTLKNITRKKKKKNGRTVVANDMCVQVVTGRPPIHQREKNKIK
jgi:hypothetical protein